MSTIGRIFSVLNVILAAAFLGFASTHLGSQQSWKKKFEDLETSSRAEIAKVTSERDEANKELGNKRSALEVTDQRLSSEQAAHNQTKSDLAAEKDRSAKSMAELQNIKTELGTYNQKLDDVNASAQAANQKAQEAIDARYAAEGARDEALAAQTKALTELEAAQKSIADLEIALTSEKKNLTQVQTTLDSLVAATGVELSEIMDAPDVKGAVVAVSTAVEPGIVSINRGTADGIKRGMTFEIFNGNIYKGTVKIESVRDNMCTGIITRAVPGTSMLQGDSAATRI